MHIPEGKWILTILDGAGKGVASRPVEGPTDLEFIIETQPPEKAKP